MAYSASSSWRVYRLAGFWGNYRYDVVDAKGGAFEGYFDVSYSTFDGKYSCMNTTDWGDARAVT